jgi:prephenate dehydrogenase
MGGSLALALSGCCREIIGVDADPAPLTFATERSIVHRTTDFDSALGTSDLLILATPVRTILAQLDRLRQLPITNYQLPILDLGSTKSEIVALMKQLPEGYDPIGGHPMCGKEVSGIEHADPDLFRGKPFVLCPLDRASPRALALAHELVSVIGAHPIILDAETHDSIAAAISHLPYAVSVALMRTALATDNEALWQMAASGFRDTTRLAASDLTMMTDILLTNRAAVLDSLSRFRAELEALTAAIESGDPAVLRAALESAQRKRSEVFK